MVQIIITALNNNKYMTKNETIDKYGQKIIDIEESEKAIKSKLWELGRFPDSFKIGSVELVMSNYDSEGHEVRYIFQGFDEVEYTAVCTTEYSRYNKYGKFDSNCLNSLEVEIL